MRKYLYIISYLFFVTVLSCSFAVSAFAETANESSVSLTEEELKQQAAEEELRLKAAEEERLRIAEETRKQKAIEDALKQKISEKGSAIEKLEKEIAEYNKSITKVQTEKKTLQSAVNELSLTQKKLLTDIAVTDTKIDSTNYTIEKIQVDINSVIKKIQTSNNTIGELIRNLDEMDEKSFVEVVLSTNELSEFWSDVENVQQFRVVVSENLSALEELKSELQAKKDENEEEISSLKKLEVKLGDQKKVVEVTKRDKSTLLQQTKSQESEYQKILKQKQAAKEAFEKEISDYESQLKFVIDESQLPKLGSGVLGWPLKDLSLKDCWGDGKGFANCVTQYFGNTSFSKTGAYNGNGHNGLDFSATVGTALYASASGLVEGTGDTDQYKGCYSYGKWVLIIHDNGLATLSGHLSLIKVTKGQQVRKGELIGYTGNTGYSTGPHLHYSVFASAGVNIVRLGDWYAQTGRKGTTPCSGASIPVAAYSAYLNPINYLAQ